MKFKQVSSKMVKCHLVTYLKYNHLIYAHLKREKLYSPFRPEFYFLLVHRSDSKL